MKWNEKKKFAWNAVLVTVFFLGCFLVLILFATGVYRAIADGHESNNRKRALLSYLLTVSRVNESDITEREGKYGEMLVISDGDTGYAVRIYMYEGHLVEDYEKPAGPLYPDAADPIAETDVFEITAVSDDLFAVKTSAGTVFLHTDAKGGAQ